MAIALKVDGFSLLPSFGVSADLISSAKELGVLVEQPFPGSFYVKFQGSVYGSVAIKGQVITMAKAGTLGPASLGAIKAQFETALAAACSAAAGLKASANGAGPSITPDEASSTAPTKSGAKKVPAPKTSKPSSIYATEEVDQGDATLTMVAVAVAGESKSFKKPSLEWDADPVTTMTSGSLMPLVKSSKLYQPVYGTSSGSVYITVALFQGLQLAGRMNGSKLSLRAEGAELKQYQTSLADLGFGYKDKDGYASVHYEVGDQTLMLKTFGAVLGRLGIPRLKEAADVTLIKGYGK